MQKRSYEPERMQTGSRVRGQRQHFNKNSVRVKNHNSSVASLRIINKMTAAGKLRWDSLSDTSQDLETLFSSLSEHGYVTEALKLLEGLLARNRKDVIAMLRHKPFLTAARNKKMVKEALNFSDVLPHEYADKRTFNMVISVCIAAKSLCGGSEVMRQLRERNISPDLILYTNMITIAARCGNTDKAFQLLQQMKENGVRPCNKAYTAVISSCSREIAKLDTCKNRRKQLVVLERVFAILQEMQEKHIEPDVALYNVLLAACGMAGEIQRLRDVYKMMMSKEISPDVVTYSTLVCALVKNGRPDEALEIYDSAILGKKVNSIRLFNVAIKACANIRVGGASKAQKIWKQMLVSGVKPDAQLFTTLIRVMGRLGDLRQVFTVFHSMYRCGVKPTRETRSILVQSHVIGGQSDRGLKILNEMAAKRTVYRIPQDFEGGPLLLIDGPNALINNCARSGSLGKAYEILQPTIKLGLSPNEVTYSGLINICFECKENELAADLYFTLRRKGMKLDHVLTMDMLKICQQKCQHLRVDPQEKRWITTRNPIGDAILHLLGGERCLSTKIVNWRDLSFDMYREAVQMGIKPTIHLLNLVISCLRKPAPISSRFRDTSSDEYWIQKAIRQKKWEK
jgi:pentatricopeptide repeat protein